MQLLALCLAIALPLILFLRSLMLARRLLKQRASRTDGILWLAVYVTGAVFSGTWLAASVSSLSSAGIATSGRLEVSLHQGPYLFVATLLVLEARKSLAFLWAGLKTAGRQCLRMSRRLFRLLSPKPKSR